MALTHETPRPSLESEQAVLGSLLIDPDIIRELLPAVREEDFLLEADREIFHAAKVLFRSGKPADAVTIAARLNKKYDDYMIQLMEITPTTAYWPEYAQIMREKALLNRAAALGSKMSAAVDLDECRAIYGRMGELLSGGSGLESWSMGELLESFFQSQAPDAPPPEYVAFGMEPLDKGSYIQRGDVVVLGGWASDGKTCLALQMAWHMAQKRKVGFFSLETDRAKLRDRLMAYSAQISLSDIKGKTIGEAQWTTLAAQASEFAKRDLRLFHAPGLTVTGIQAASQAYGFEVIFIDYVQLIIPETPPRTTRQEQMASVSRALHTFAQSSKTLVVELAQLHRTDQDKWRAPNMHDLRETGQFEQDADMILLLYQPGPKSKLDKDNSRILTIGKNKEGRRGDWPLYFDGEKQTFSVMAGEDGNAVMRRFQAEGRKAKARNRQAPGQVEFTELPGRDDGLPF